MNTLKLPNVWKKVNLFESTSFNNNMTKKITEYIKQYQTISNYIFTSINYYQSSKEESNCYTCTKTPAYKTSRGLCVKFRIWINYSFQLGFLRRLTHCITTISAEMMIKELQQSV